MTKIKNIVISGTNFWNPGDDFVRDGVVQILKSLFDGYILNFLFYNFNADFFPHTKFSGISNTVQNGDLDNYKDKIDYIVIAGLSAGVEIKDLYKWIIKNNLQNKVYLIGAGYENQYVDKYISQEPEATIFKNARVITGRTFKRPKFVDENQLKYYHINCPAILSVQDEKTIPQNKKIERIGFSIQLPKKVGILNQLCSQENFDLAIYALTSLKDMYNVEIIAHHKSEYFVLLELFKKYNIPVIFSSFYQDLHHIYPRYDLIITTRLHASLFANGFGIPGIIINNTDRHTHCLEGFPHSVWVDSKEKFEYEFNKITDSDLSQIPEETHHFKNELLKKYIHVLAQPFGVKYIDKTKQKPPDKLHVGCGFDYREGFVNVDGNENLPKVDVVLNIKPGALSKVFDNATFKQIVAKDFIEHHFHWEAHEILKEFYDLLAPKGQLELVLPNIEKIIKDETKTINEKKQWLYGGQDIGTPEDSLNQQQMRKKYPLYYCHKYGWTKESIQNELKKIGFSVIEIEDNGWNMRVIVKKNSDSISSLSHNKNANSGIVNNIKSADDVAFDSEKKEQNFVKKNIKKGMTVFDVGANIGKYTRLLSFLVGDEGTVYSFEPSNFALNKLKNIVLKDKLSNVELINAAVYSKDEQIILNEFPEEYCSWNSIGKPQMPNPKNANELVPIINSVQVQGITLDKFCTDNEIRHIDYLKIDVEGAELDALKGSINLLSSKAVDMLQFEISKKMLEGYGTTAKPVFNFLEKHGYYCYELDADGEIGDRAFDSDSFYENYISLPYLRSVKKSDNLPVDFFTIVLNGEPFIRHHIDVFKHLPFKWHWHIIEGVAELKHDTAWSKKNGGRINEKLHNDGLSNDGTTQYLDELQTQYPDNISVYRKGKGRFWNGKLEMVNAPLKNIMEECLLWQIDSDELWTPDQIITSRELFISNPKKTAAYYYCNFFVGQDLVITTRNTYGNHTDYEWIRTWRYIPGCEWKAHEPPTLGFYSDAKEFVDLAKVNPFTHSETELKGLVFQHAAYMTENQLGFKEVYYGYKNAVQQWQELQSNTSWPVYLKDYFEWVNDESIVDKMDKYGVQSLVVVLKNKEWRFKRQYAVSTEVIKIAYLRPDSIGDTIISAGMLEEIKIAYPNAKIFAICQDHIAELYENCPFVEKVISFNKNRIYEDEAYNKRIASKIKQLNVDVLLNPVYSRSILIDYLASICNARQKIAFLGDTSNMSKEEWEKNNKLYTTLIPIKHPHMQEIDRYQDYLKIIGNSSGKLYPELWLKEKNISFANNIFNENSLKTESTITFFANAQYNIKNFSHWNKPLKDFCEKNGFSLIILGDGKSTELNKTSAKGIKQRVIDLSGKTTLLETAAIIQKSRLAVGVDTAMAHMACAVGTPNIILMGGGHFGRFLPYSNLTSIICLPLSCYNCNWSCPYPQAYCVEKIHSKVVSKAFEIAISSIPQKPRIFIQGSNYWKSEKDSPHWQMFNHLIDMDSVEIETIGTAPIISSNYDLNLKNANNNISELVNSPQLGNVSKCNELGVPAILVNNYFQHPAVNTEKYIKLKFSVITPSFNNDKYIEQTIKSVLEQEYLNFTHHIIDGGSTDQTVGILKKYPHLDWISEKDDGQSQALNKGFSRADGEIIAWINSDDWYEPGVFHRVAEFFLKNPDKNVVMGNCNLIDESGQIFNVVVNHTRGFDELIKYMVGQSIPTQPAIFFRKKLLDHYGVLDESLFYAMDYDLWLRFAIHNRFYHINEIFANYRFHSDAKGGDQDWKKFMPEWKKVSEKYQKIKSGNPLISVIIPCYNYGRYLAETVESVIKQTYSNTEIIIINDGSTDNTREVAEQLIGIYGDEKILLINQDNSGQPAISRNNGIRIAKGEFILPLDGDDKIAPDMLEKCFNTLSEKNVAIAYTDRLDFDGVDQIIPAGDYDFAKLIHANQISHCALYKKEVWEKVGSYRLNVRGVEDWDFWVAAGALGYFGHRVAEPLFHYRRHDTGVYQDVVPNYELKFAQIILNNPQLYTDQELKWAKEKLKSDRRDEQEFRFTFSVIIPTYNRADMLRAAIESVLKQTFEDFEIIVVNDAGNDVQPVIESIKDKRVRLLNHSKNKGLAAARNTGIKAAQGKYIALLDDDDIFLPEHLETAVSVLTDICPVIYSDAIRASYNKEDDGYKLIDTRIPYSMDFDRNKLLIGNISPVNCFVFEREQALKAGLFDESFSTLEDWEFWIRLSQRTDFKHIPKATVQVNWRTDGTTMTSSRQSEFSKNREAIYSRYKHEISAINNLQNILDEFNRIWSQDNRYSTDLPDISTQSADTKLASIIMLTYNALEYTKKCVNSILTNTKHPYEIIIVDNNSTDGTKKYLRELQKAHNHISVVFNKKNKGFAAGNNQAVKRAKGDYVMILNNDVLVGKGWLSGLVQALEADEKIGMVGPLTNSISGLQMVAKVPYKDDEGFYKYAADFRRNYGGNVTPRRRIAGFAVLMKKSLYREVGGFDESYGTGNFEDDDLCLKVRRKGYAVMVDEGTFIHHYGSQSFKANKIDYNASLEEKGKHFKQKWPDVDYEELLEIKNPLHRLHEKQMGEASQLFSVGNPEQAQEIYLSILKDNPISSEALLSLAICAQSVGDNTSAIVNLKKVIKLCPENPMAYNQLGIISVESGDLEGSKTFFATAIEKDPAFIDAQRNYGNVLIELEDYENGVKVFHEILQNHPDDIPSLLYMAQLYVEAAKYEEGLKYMKRVMLLDNKNETALELMNIIKSEAAAGLPSEKEADNKIDTARIAEAPQEYYSLVEDGGSKLKEGDTAGAKKCYLDFLRTNPNDLASLYGMGLALRMEQNNEEAFQFFKRIIQIEPKFTAAYNNLGSIALINGNLEEALKYFARAVELEPHQAEAKQNLSDVLIELGHYEEGVKIIMSALKDNPEDIMTLIRIGKLHFEAGKGNESKTYFEKAVKLDPGNEMAAEYLNSINAGSL